MTCAAADVSVESEMIGLLARGRIQRHDATLFKEADKGQSFGLPIAQLGIATNQLRPDAYTLPNLATSGGRLPRYFHSSLAGDLRTSTYEQMALRI